MKVNSTLRALTLFTAMTLVLTSCMYDTKSLKTYELPGPSTHQKRTAPQGTIPYSSKQVHQTSQANQPNQTLPGQELYQIHCQICHGPQGRGQHQLREYGLPTPPSFHLESVKLQPISFLTDVMKNGRGAMVSYKGRLTPEERKQVAKYIVSLQSKGEKE